MTCKHCNEQESINERQLCVECNAIDQSDRAMSFEVILLGSLAAVAFIIGVIIFHLCHG